MDLSWVNGAAVGGLRNSLKEKHARPDVPRYGCRWRVTYVARVSRDAQGPV